MDQPMPLPDVGREWARFVEERRCRELDRLHCRPSQLLIRQQEHWLERETWDDPMSRNPSFERLKLKLRGARRSRSG